jgi:hypothetical protein
MKIKLFCAYVAVILVISTPQAHALISGLKTNEFEINQVDNLFLGKSAEKVWTLAYSNQEKPVTIALRTVGNNKEYVVRSQYFEVIYASDSEGFGARKIHSTLKEVPAKINHAVLNKEQLENQKVITPNKVTDEYALGLIASYLPDLLNEGYQHLIL